jgi:hypothetical protein
MVGGCGSHQEDLFRRAGRRDLSATQDLPLHWLDFVDSGFKGMPQRSSCRSGGRSLRGVSQVLFALDIVIAWYETEPFSQ